MPQGVPAYMANLWTTYQFRLFGRAGFHAGAGVNYMSRTTNGFANGYDWAPAYVIGVVVYFVVRYRPRLKLEWRR